VSTGVEPRDLLGMRRQQSFLSQHESHEWRLAPADFLAPVDLVTDGLQDGMRNKSHPAVVMVLDALQEFDVVPVQADSIG
jgi:hypothetical protein